MFLDNIVLAGLLVVGASLVFLGGVWCFIYWDAHNSETKPTKSEEPEAPK